MKPWRIIVPLKPAGARKTRLSAALDNAARDRLAEAMFWHVASVIGEVSDAEMVLLSPEPPSGWSGAWRSDIGGLNATLQHLRTEEPDRGFAVINADLPLLTPLDVSALLDGARSGEIAIAADRHGTGTNALAVPPGREIPFCFGAGSLGRFRASAGSAVHLVDRPGLAIDVDSPADLDFASRRAPSWHAGRLPCRHGTVLFGQGVKEAAQAG